MPIRHNRTIPGESREYREARNELLEKEAEIRRLTEEAAALRRALPRGGPLKDDYIFRDRNGPRPLSDLFGKHDTLLLYSFMYKDSPCPMCTSLLDAWDAQMPYWRERLSLAVVARTSIDSLTGFAARRGWQHLPLLSGAGTSYQPDYHCEYETQWGDQHPVLNVFRRDDTGIHHFWASELYFCELDGQPRHMDLTWPLWNVLDLTPMGRGDDWYPALQK